jgi:hypothetical protein
MPGAAPDPAVVALTDRVAELTLLADAGDRTAEAALTVLWATDDRLRPGRYVTTWSPTGRLGWTDLVACRTGWAAVPRDAVLVG